MEYTPKNSECQSLEAKTNSPCGADSQSEMPEALGRILAPGMVLKRGRFTETIQGWRFLVLHCPYCGREHVHGWPAPDDPEQFGGAGSTRLSHCIGKKIKGTGFPGRFSGGGDYILVPVDEVRR